MCHQLSLLLLAGLRDRFHFPETKCPLSFSAMLPNPQRKKMTQAKARHARLQTRLPPAEEIHATSSKVFPTSYDPQGNLTRHRCLSNEGGCCGHRESRDLGFYFSSTIGFLRSQRTDLGKDESISMGTSPIPAPEILFLTVSLALIIYMSMTM